MLIGAATGAVKGAVVGAVEPLEEAVGIETDRDGEGEQGGGGSKGGGSQGQKSGRKR
jgi:hypothetical protein